MGKLLLLLAIIGAVYWWLRRPRSVADKQPADAGEAETMVSCAYCGLHVPLKESILDEDHRYCCDEHRRLAAGGRGD